MDRKVSPSLSQRFLRTEASSGIVLMIAAGLAIVMANSPLHDAYEWFLHININLGITKTAHHWINDGLMAIFFFLVGLEIKKEITMGSLSTRAGAMLPVLAAVGGMVVPTLVFVAINRATPGNLHGWAIASATDIAFALGILSLLGSRAPASLKMLLMAIAVIDDLGAVIIIALFYTADLSPVALGCAAFFIACLAALKKIGVDKAAPYVFVGLFLWMAVLESGVHATLAGVITALFIPRGKLDHIIHLLHPWVAFLIMPLFAFANAGVSAEGLSLTFLTTPLPLGIAAGLFIGKQLGVFGTLYAAIKAKICPMPKGASWRHLYGLALLCGIGFTMSLFIGSLAFGSEEAARAVRIGVLSGSLLSAAAGYLLLMKR